MRRAPGAAPRGAGSPTCAAPRPERFCAGRAAEPCSARPQGSQPQLGGGPASDVELLVAPSEPVEALGDGGSGLAWAAVVTSLVSSVVALPNSRIAFPTAPPSSGRRPGPQMIRTTISSMTT